MHPCPKCNGNGCSFCDMEGAVCSTCKGTGFSGVGDICETCGGHGSMSDAEKQSSALPKAIAARQRTAKWKDE